MHPFALGSAVVAGVVLSPRVRKALQGIQPQFQNVTDRLKSGIQSVVTLAAGALRNAFESATDSEVTVSTSNQARPSVEVASTKRKSRTKPRSATV